MSSLCDITKKKLSSKYPTKMLDFKRQSSTYLYLNKEPYNYWFDIFYWLNMQFFYFCNTIFCQTSSRRVSNQGMIKHRMIWAIRKKLSKVTIVGKSSWEKFLKTQGKQMKKKKRNKTIIASLNTFLNTLIKHILQERIFSTCKSFGFHKYWILQFWAKFTFPR